MSCRSTSLSARGHANPPRADCTVCSRTMRLFISSSWTARSSFLPRPCFDRVCRAVPRACNGQAVFSSMEALACSTPTNGCGTRRKDEGESREENLLAADRRRKDQVGSRIGKKDGECMRRPSQMRRIEGYSTGKMSVWLHGDVSPASCVSEIAGHTRAHAEARGDRTRTPVPSQRAACSGLRTERRKFCALQRAGVEAPQIMIEQSIGRFSIQVARTPMASILPVR
jgi:hypothetical protein